MAQNKMSRFRIILIGGSAGSLEVILNIINGLPKKPDAVFVIIMHRRSDKDSILQNLLSYKSKLPVKEVEDKEIIHNDTIYLAPPGYHLLVENSETFSLDSSEKVHFCRPSIDVTFESVAEIFTTDVTALLLSGANADGALGLKIIRQMGGRTLVQNPATAEVSFMPQQAVNLKVADEILDANRLLPRIQELLGL